MTERDEGGPAFPQHDLSGYGIGPATSGVDPSDPYSGKYEVTGMTLRDWFAGQALAIVYMRFPTFADPEPLDLAMQAYFIADAMLEARK